MYKTYKTLEEINVYIMYSGNKPYSIPANTIIKMYYRKDHWIIKDGKRLCYQYNHIIKDKVMEV